jgi:hypothetical protein
MENWNATNDVLTYGRQGELATNSREEQEVVTLSLQLLQNCLMLINTMLIERTIKRDQLWERLSEEDRWGLSPLFHGHVNPYGQFALVLRAFTEKYLDRVDADLRQHLIAHLNTSWQEYNHRFAHPFEWSWTRRDLDRWAASHSSTSSLLWWGA